VAAAHDDEEGMTRRVSGLVHTRQQLAELAASTADLQLTVGETVEYFSTRNNSSWVRAKVLELHGNGQVSLDVKARAELGRIRRLERRQVGSGLQRVPEPEAEAEAEPEPEPERVQAEPQQPIVSQAAALSLSQVSDTTSTAGRSSGSDALDDPTPRTAIRNFLAHTAAVIVSPALGSSQR
jgi:hypothetical protein